jgi:D-mannonate dehydratase
MYAIMKAITTPVPDTTCAPTTAHDLGGKWRPGYGLYDRALGIAYLNV